MKCVKKTLACCVCTCSALSRALAKEVISDLDSTTEAGSFLFMGNRLLSHDF